MSSPLLLLVDDAPDTALIVQRLARRAGHEVVCHRDVASAWNYLSSGERPDLILLDYNLPGGPGVELIHLLRRRPEGERIPIALLGSWERPDDLVAGLEAGAEFVACKELLATPSAWQQRVWEILRGDDGRIAARSVVCQQTDSDPNVPNRSDSILRSLDRLLRQACVRRMGRDVLRVLIYRTNAGRAIPDEVSLTAHGFGLDLNQVRNNKNSDVVIEFACALTEQVWCMLGEEALAALRTPPAS